jgi:hypothetical protein
VPFGRLKLLSGVLDPDGVRTGGRLTKPEHLKAKNASNGEVQERYHSPS